VPYLGFGGASRRQEQPGWYSEDLEQLFRLLVAGALELRVFERLPLERAGDSLEMLSQTAVNGKIVLFADGPGSSVTRALLDENPTANQLEDQ